MFIDAINASHYYLYAREHMSVASLVMPNDIHVTSVHLNQR